MISQTRHPHLRVACMALVLLVAGLSGVSTGTGGDRPVFSGQATAVTAKVLGITLPPLADTGYFEGEEFLPPTQCTEIAVPELSVEAAILCASTRGQGNHSFSNAHVAALDANVAGVPVTATLLRSEASARCSALAPVVAGEAELVSARVGDVTIDDPLLPPTPRNQPIPIGDTGAYFIVGETTQSFNGNYGDITFTALRVVVPGLVPGMDTDTDVSFARVHADVRCQGRPVCPQPRFVTGGGFLRGKRHFVIAFREGDLDWGHLMYSDKAAGVRITAAKPFTSPPDVYPWPDADGGGTVTGETTSGTAFVASVIDAGEPGRQDWFELTGVEPGYLEGGNIQVHKPCRNQ